MKWIFKFLLVMTLLPACTDAPTLPENGVALSLAKERKASISDLEYDLNFQIPEEKSEAILAKETIRFQYKGRSGTQLDFKEKTENLKRITVNGRELALRLVNEHVSIPHDYLQGENVVEIDFIAGNLSLNRNEEYLYTLLVPDRARTVFPVMDQPDMKAKWRLSLDIPLSWEAVANGPMLSMEQIDPRKIIHFQQTQPISSYLFAFAAGKFEKMTNPEGTMTMYYRESDTSKVHRNAPEIFDLHQEALDQLEDYTGLKYPFQKFDFALIPTFQYGGMEHPGAIFYRERSLMLDESASVNQKLRRASLIAHETAHMWFGDLVTMKWFDDVWLKEVFANFMAAKIINPSFPEINHDLRFLLAHYPGAYEIDRSEGTHPIQQYLDNLQNAGSLYGAIIYQKAPIVMRNLETILGQESFRNGLKAYLNRFAFNNATWDDLIEILAEHTEQNLQQWNHDWVKSGGMPEIAVSHQPGQLNYQVLNATSGLYWPQQIQAMINGNNVSFLLEKEYQQDIQTGPYTVNADGRGYGFFNLDENSLENIWRSVNGQEDLERAAGWVILWESFLHGKIKIESFYHRLIAAIENEENPLILEYLLGSMETVYWHFFDLPQRNQSQKQTEEVLFNGMTKSSDQSLKRNFYNTYSSVVGSEQGTSYLEKIWADKLSGFNFPLYENDKIRLALQLLIREVPNATEIVKKQFELTENPDNRNRLTFILPSVSADPTERDDFFKSLLLAENRGQEPWVSEALSWLHHPRRADSSVKYLKPGLEIIEEIKATGDIFFPKAWLDASLAGHRSKEAAEIVRTFVQEHPDLPPDLKNKILQSADLLFRSQVVIH